jgi:hypothetical protein
MFDSPPDAAPPDSAPSESPLPAIDEVALGSVTARTDARQGEGALLVTLHGSGLDGAVVTIGGLAITPKSVSPTEVVVNVEVPHGAPLGAHDVVVTTPHGQATAPAGFTITPITVAVGGDDDAIGSAAAPLATLARAVELAQAGDEIRMTAGNFPQADRVDLPAGVVLRGTRPLLGKPTTLVADGANVDGLSIGENGAIHDLVLSGFGTCMRSDVGAVTVEHVVTHDCFEFGLRIDGAKVAVSDVTITVGADAEGRFGIAVYSGSAKLRRATIEGPQTAFRLTGTGVADLGTRLSPGENVLFGTELDIDDTRPALPAPTGAVLSIHGTRMHAKLAENVCPDELITGPAEQTPMWRILELNQRIRCG